MRPQTPITGSSPLEYAFEDQRRRNLADQLVAGRGIRIQRMHNGTVIESTATGGGKTTESAEIKRFRVMSVEDDWLNCVEEQSDGDLPNPVPGDNLWIKVAKPPELRPSAFVGSTWYTGYINAYSQVGSQRIVAVTETVVGETNPRTVNVSEYLDPDYKAYDGTDPDSILEGTTIWAIKKLGSSLTTGDGTPIEWIDLNIAARHFRPAYHLIGYCRDNVVSYIPLSGAPAT
jgi:hypothetical protein